MCPLVTRLLFHGVNQADRTAEGEEAPSFMFGKRLIARVVIYPHVFLHMHKKAET